MSDYPLPNGFNEPIQIVGISEDGSAKRFEVNLLDANGEFLLHYNIRYDEGRVIRNSTHSGQQWQREERDGGMPFHVGKEFTLDLVPGGDNSMQCMVNGNEQCYFRGREGNIHEAAKLNIGGDVKVINVQLPGEGGNQRRDAGDEPAPNADPLPQDTNPDWGEGGDQPPPEEPMPNIVSPPEPQPDQPQPQQPGGAAEPLPDLPPVSHPTDPGQLSVPYHCPLQDFARTRRLRVVGTPTPGAKKFEVVLRQSNGDAMLHFNPRLDVGCVYRNATHNNVWQPQWEDKSGNGCPFREGEQFVLDLIASGDVISCFVNGPEYCKYKIHGNINESHTLQIAGDVQLSQVLIA